MGTTTSTTGYSNTAVGVMALKDVLGASRNTAVNTST